MGPDPQFLEHLGFDLPIIQAPMAGSQGSQLAIAVCEAGALGSLPCAMLSVEQAKKEAASVRAATNRPFNLNFFCHRETTPDPDEISNWRQLLAPFYKEAGIDLPSGPVTPGRVPFSAESCELVEELRPPVVSFHFGLPEPVLYDRVRALGSVILASATTTREAKWLEERGVDAIIAQGAEAGGHRGIFLDDDVSSQPGTFALVPQVVDAINIPVIAAGGIADGRGIAAAFALGASAVQIGTAFLFTREASPTPIHLDALGHADDANTAMTNLLTGRPARGVINRFMREAGPLNSAAPAFPLAANDVSPLRAEAEARSQRDFSPLWSGQSAALARKYLGKPAGEVSLELIREAQSILSGDDTD